MFNFSPNAEAHSTRSPAAARPASNEAIAQGLEAIASLLRREEREAARAAAVRRAAAAIRSHQRSLIAGIADQGVEAVHALGINYELAGIVTDWVRLGRLHWLEQLEARQQRALAELPGIGPRLAKELREVLGVVDLDGLAVVARDGRLQQVCGFGPKRLKLVISTLMGRERPTDTRQLMLLQPSASS